MQDINIKENIKELLLDCKLLGIEITFTNGQPGENPDPKHIFINVHWSEVQILDVLKSGIDKYITDKKNKPGDFYVGYYNEIKNQPVNNIQMENIKKKYNL